MDNSECTLKLTGFFNPVGCIPGFIVPIFADKLRSNHIFAQTVNHDGHIVGFQPVEVQCQWVEDSELRGAKGSPALYGFQWNEKEHRIGLLSDLRADLIERGTAHCDAIGPFLRLEIVEFCGLTEQIPLARRAAFSYLLSYSRKWAYQWRNNIILLQDLRSLLSSFIDLVAPEESGNSKNILNQIYSEGENSVSFVLPIKLQLLSARNPKAWEAVIMSFEQVARAFSKCDVNVRPFLDAPGTSDLPPWSPKVLDSKPEQAHGGLSAFQTFTRREWAELRHGVQLTLSDDDLARLAGLIDRVSHEEVKDIYLPISKLVNYYVRAAQLLRSATTRFFHQGEAKTPFIIGIAGSVAVGKSTSARVLRELLARWPNHPRVDLVPTDGFLWPNAELERRGIMHRKGFPESFDQARLLQFLDDVKAGRSNVVAPIYSHYSCDVAPSEKIIVDKPDILIVEGQNVLQPTKLPRYGDAVPFFSDFFDFSIYIDADPALIEMWYVTRFLRLCREAFRDKDAYFYRYSQLPQEQAIAQALKLWRTINLVNLKKNILPTRKRANLILSKGEDQRVEKVALRK